MKKPISLLIVFACLTFSINVVFASVNSSITKIEAQQESQTTGYIQAGNQWKKISIVYVVMNGQYVLKAYSMQGYGGMQGGYNSKIMRLNPNNPYAVQFNFSHYVDTPSGSRVYLSLE